MDPAPMARLLRLSKALSDYGRVRALLLLAHGELCVCQIIAVLGLAPSTVSRHMSMLHDAGLVVRRKQGRWHYYRLPGRDAPAAVRDALRWVRRALAGDPSARDDAETLEGILCMELSEVTSCYPSAP